MKIDNNGRLSKSGIPHWVVLVMAEEERCGYGFVTIFNPAPNCAEAYSWREFTESLGFLPVYLSPMWKGNPIDAPGNVGNPMKATQRYAVQSCAGQGGEDLQRQAHGERQMQAAWRQNPSGAASPQFNMDVMPKHSRARWRNAGQRCSRTETRWTWCRICWCSA